MLDLPTMSDWMIQIETDKDSTQLPLDKDKITVGRASTNDVVLEDQKASRNHCVIERGNSGWRVRDLNSSNGTLVNGKSIAIERLRAGDIILIGTTRIRMGTAESLAHSTGGALDLSADDLIDDGGGEFDINSIDPSLVIDLDGADFSPMTLTNTNPAEYEPTLVRIANALPQRDFDDHHIELGTSAGGVIYPKADPTKRRGPREAVDLLRLVLLVCFRTGASDIHLEPRDDGYLARLRIDGDMVDLAKMPTAIGLKLSTIVKVLGEIDIQFKDAIQEGAFTARVPTNKPGSTRRVDYRISFAPGVFGQKLVCRILDAANAPATIKDLNLPAWVNDELTTAVKQESGMVLVCGPTGSGKTTTLYALLRSIATRNRNVTTIEDPVEIQLPGVTQIPVDEAGGKSFAALLRSLLRQDPDVILVGEVRDAETARTAMQAAITGHLVFSTLHTKDTIGTVFRLLDLGVEPFLCAQALQIVLAQRLVRKLCPKCKKGVPLIESQRAAMGAVGRQLKEVFIPVGCPECLGTGFAKRVAFFEMLQMSPELRDAVSRKASLAELDGIARQGAFVSLKQAGYELVAKGLVSFDEVEESVGRGIR
jgi:general secretion pathway protein E